MPRTPLQSRKPPQPTADPGPSRDQRVDAALSAHHNGLSLAKAADEHNVPLSTLKARKRGRRSLEEAGTDRCKLDPDAEQALVKWALGLADRNIQPTPALIRARAAWLLRRDGNPEASVEVQWTRQLRKRHPELSAAMARRPIPLKIEACNSKTVSSWFASFQRLLDEHGIPTDLIWNMAEIRFELGLRTRRQIVYTSPANPRAEMLLEPSERIPVIECIRRGDGQSVQPFIVLKSSDNTICESWIPQEDKNGVGKFQIGVTPSGTPNGDICLQWLLHSFIPATLEVLRQKEATDPDTAWRCLLVDNVRAHLSHEFLLEAERQRILVVALPPKTYHKLQPLDVGVFEHLKKGWDNRTLERMFGGPSRIHISDFLSSYAEIRQAKVDDRLCQEAFDRCGISNKLNRKRVLADLKGKQASKLASQSGSGSRWSNLPDSVQVNWLI